MRTSHVLCNKIESVVNGFYLEMMIEGDNERHCRGAWSLPRAIAWRCGDEHRGKISRFVHQRDEAEGAILEMNPRCRLNSPESACLG